MIVSKRKLLKEISSECENKVYDKEVRKEYRNIKKHLEKLTSREINKLFVKERNYNFYRGYFDREWGAKLSENEFLIVLATIEYLVSIKENI